MKASILAAALLGALTVSARAQTPQPDYLDNRSDAAALIHSLYNAINRHEYARAWSYFSEPPADSLDAYADGYADTRHVEVMTGAVAAEGAAGSQFFHVPVAIEAQKTDGSYAVFAGCYQLRLADPAIQGEDFRPLHIESAKLAASDKMLSEAVPASCPGAPPVEGWDPGLEKARAKFKAAFSDVCNMTPPDPSLAEPELYDIPFNYTYDAEDAPKRHAKLYRFWCNFGAYNEMHVYFLADEYGETRPLQFAEPSLDVRYVNDDTDGAVELVSVIGYLTISEMINSEYNPDTKELTAFEKWRGLADASSTGTWVFRDGHFDLVKYDVDASYDGEMNPQTVLDYHSGP